MVTLAIYAYRLLPESGDVAYCFFEKDLRGGELPRHECAILRISTTEMKSVGLERLQELENISCAEQYDLLPHCAVSNETSFGMFKLPLDTFCTTENCSVNGLVCGGYYIDYYNESVLRVIYEDRLFDKKPTTEQSLLKELEECDYYG